MLSEMSQAQEDKSREILLTCGIHTSQSHSKSRKVVTRGWGPQGGLEERKFSGQSTKFHLDWRNKVRCSVTLRGDHSQ